MEIPKIIWMYWDKGWDKTEYVVQNCRRSWIYYNPEWKIHFLDDSSLPEYFDIDKWNADLKNSKIMVQASSDIIRINLLKKYGGVWADATLWCNRPLDEWLPRHIEQEFFAFSKPKPDRLICSWFLASSLGGYITDVYANEVSQFWKTRPSHIPYHWFHNIFDKLYETDIKFRQTWDLATKQNAGIGFGNNQGEGPHWFTPWGRGFRRDQPLDEEYVRFLNSTDIPVFKLNNRAPKIAGRSARLDYLFNTLK